MNRVAPVPIKREHDSSKNVVEEEESPRRHHSSRRQRLSEEEGEVTKKMDDIVKDLRSNDTAVLESAMLQLRQELNHQNDVVLEQKQERFFDLDAHTLVAFAMFNHPNHERLQNYSLRVFMGAMHRNNAAKNSVAKVNGIQAIVAAMRRFHDSRDIQFFGLKALKSLCYLTANSELLVHRMGCVPMILHVMRNFPYDGSIVETASDLIFECCHHKGMRKPILCAKAATVLAAAFEIHMNNERVAEAALDALNILTKDPGPSY